MLDKTSKSILPDIVILLLLSLILIDGYKSYLSLINYVESSIKRDFQDSLADQNITPSYPPSLVQEPMHACIPNEVDPNDYFNRYRDRLAKSGDWIGLPELGDLNINSGMNPWGFMNCQLLSARYGTNST